MDVQHLLVSHSQLGDEGLQEFLEATQASAISDMFAVFMFARWIADQDDPEQVLAETMGYIRNRLEEKAAADLEEVQRFVEQTRQDPVGRHFVGHMQQSYDALEQLGPRVQEATNTVVAQFSAQIRNAVRELRGE